MKTPHLLTASLFLASALVPAAAVAQDRATAQIVDTSNQQIGNATFTEGPDGLLIDLEVSGLPAGEHGIHMHKVGTCDDYQDGFKASGSHVNPDDKKHGLLNPDGPDAGDLPNLWAVEGTTRYQFYTPYASLTGAGERANLLDDDGTALVIHMEADDQMTQPIGGAGNRIACGVIRGS